MLQTFSSLQVVIVASHWCPDLRIFELLVFAALVPYTFVTNLKVLSWFASFANILTAGGLVIVFQYCIQHLEPIDSVPAFKSWGTLPLYFGTAIYAFEGIALVCPTLSFKIVTNKCQKRMFHLNFALVWNWVQRNIPVINLV